MTLRRGILFTIVLLAALLAGSTEAEAANKVAVCHIPPDAPEDFHTITVSENALSAHLAHGDVAGGCLENCEILCDDGDACTIDACDPVTGECLVDHPPVDCDDGLLCTTDSCDPGAGCIYTPVTCTPPDLCTITACSEADGGACIETPVACGVDEVCDPDTGLCTDPCSGVVCEPSEQCLVSPGTCSEGECFFDPAPDGTACDDGDPATAADHCLAGACLGTPTGGFLSLEGHVSDADGLPIAGAEISVFDLLGILIDSAISDPYGEYEVYDLPSFETYTLSVTADGYADVDILFFLEETATVDVAMPEL